MEELGRLADPTPEVTGVTRGIRRQRAEQLDEVHTIVARGDFYALGFRSATDWLYRTTGEGIGHCKITLQLAERIQQMPLIKCAFAAGQIPETNLRSLDNAWCSDIADVFERDEHLLRTWAAELPQRVVTDTQFDTLHVRDHGCRWPGCGIPAGSCDAHHATRWLDGGETAPDNLVLLCWFHHHLLHEQHWSIEPLGGGHFDLNSPRGDSQTLRPPLVGLTPPTQPPLPLPPV